MNASRIISVIPAKAGIPLLPDAEIPRGFCTARKRLIRYAVWIMKPLLLATVLVTGCAHAGAGGNGMHKRVEQELAKGELCVRMPSYDGGRRDELGSVFLLYGVREADGTEVFDDAARKGFEAFVKAGLMTVQQRDILRHEGRTRIHRTYSPTSLGREHFRSWTDLTKLGDRFCYGSKSLLQILSFSRIQTWGGCAKTMSVELLYRFVGFPLWTDEPELRAAFPDMLTREQDSIVRYENLPLILRDDVWVRGSYFPPHSTCVGHR
jgi:hypothetical protein